MQALLNGTTTKYHYEYNSLQANVNQIKLLTAERYLFKLRHSL